VSISTPGSGGDAITRLLAERMGPILKGTMFVDNKVGAGGAIAADFVAKAPADGYTLLLGGFTSQVLLAAVRPKLPYDPVKDFDPIGQIGTAAILLVATNDFPAGNLKEFVALAKKAADSPLYGSWGVGSTGHFCGELLAQRAGVKLSHVAYKGVGPLQSDLLGGQIKIAFIDMATASPMVKASRAKAIASCISRSPSLPEVRGFDEDGIDFSGKSVIAPMWAVYAPAGTPKPVLDKLSAALKQVVETPEVKDKLLGFGVTVDFIGTEPYRKLLADGIPQWRDIARKSDIVID
jgi:tripartite-type tricarboxylate transporter receptor subunit TctC